jgi:HD-GYP domain-containing protein (c-di-GMP phosphodiesterase class II)/DNA-binding CsgD family transcriptional regulator
MPSGTAKRINVQPTKTEVPVENTLRFAELLAALSLETDLGMGHPPEEAMRSCLLATGLARRLGHAEDEVADVYWTALLMHVGCTAYAHEQAAVFGGDEIAVNDIGSKTDFGAPREAVAFLLELSRAMSPMQRARILFAGMVRGPRFGREVAVATCEVAAGMGRRLGMSPGVQRGLNELFERWDGRGEPQRLAAEGIALPARLAQLAAQAVVFARLGGTGLALEMARRRAGTGLDPGLVTGFLRHGAELLDGIDGGDPWTAVLAAEPAPQLWIPDVRLDEVARAFADAVDLKSTFTLGHSAGVAELAEAAGRLMGLAATDVLCVRRAALLHDLGRVGVPNGIWEKPGRLTTSEWEQVRLHPYHTERILSRSSTLAVLAPVAGMHHERLDGSGYHRAASAATLGLPARLLAAADAFQAMTQARPHRPALSGSEAADALATDAREGRLDRMAVDALLAAAGLRHEVKAPVIPAGLTDREIDVLRLLARGNTNKQMGRRLFISPKTVGHHVEHIYQKLGVSSRAAAAMFALEHGLMDERYGSAAGMQGSPSRLENGAI